MKRLVMKNGTVKDATEYERCPECGRPLDHVAQRGDSTAYVHATYQRDADRECIT